MTMFDVIERTPSAMEHILAIRDENFAPLFSYLGDNISTLDEIVFIGSGTSDTSARTSRVFVEKVTKMKTSVYFPTDFCFNTYSYNPKALYIFTSQTGTSKVVRQAQNLIKDKGYFSVSVTASPDSLMATESLIHIDMGCGKEEYGQRTLGYSASVFTHMLLGLEIAKHRGTVTEVEYNEYLAKAKAVPDSHRGITKRAMEWMDKAKRKMLRSQCLMIIGADALLGVAMEGAMKMWEIPQIVSIGYELEESLHGPNFGYNHNQCVIVLNDGGRENEKARTLARWVKDTKDNGFVIGANTIDDTDFPIDLVGGSDFCCLEIAPAVQVMAYRLATDQGRDLNAPQDHSVMRSYFSTHESAPEKA